jgi:two-component system LytT family response regulator
VSIRLSTKVKEIKHIAMIKAVIIDDEARARESLAMIINQFFPEIELLGSADGVESGFTLINTVKPNVVFLDIKMGDGSGFDLLRKYQKIPFKTVFVTAFDEHALEAFKFSAFDYLLKPVDTEELRQSIDRIAESLDYDDDVALKIKAFLANMEVAQQSQKKIVLKTSNSIHLININTIVRCEADANYSWIYVQNLPKILISKPLKHFEDLLQDYGFFRAHQSHLVNLNFISRIDKVDGGVIVLKDNTNVPVAVRKREQLFQILNNL